MLLLRVIKYSMDKIQLFLAFYNKSTEGTKNDVEGERGRLEGDKIESKSSFYCTITILMKREREAAALLPSFLPPRPQYFDVKPFVEDICAP